MKFIKRMKIKEQKPKMKTEINNFNDFLNKISIYQLTVNSLIGLIFFTINELEIYTAFIISALAIFSYTQLIRLSSLNKLLSLFGFPVRLILVGIPTAILVHKLHCNLIALFIGFLISQVVYFCFVWSYANELKKKEEIKRT